MQRSHRRFELGIFGGSGSGKTTYAAKFIANVPSRCVFLFDPEGEFSQVLDLQPCRTDFEIDEGMRIGWVCFDPHTKYPGDLETALSFFCDLAFRASGMIPGRKFFVVDELGQYVTGSVLPHPLKKIVQTGRRYGLDCVFIGQQPNHIHNAVRTQLSEVVCFQLTDERALDFPALDRLSLSRVTTEAVKLPTHRASSQRRNRSGCRRRPRHSPESHVSMRHSLARHRKPTHEHFHQRNNGRTVRATGIGSKNSEAANKAIYF